MQCLGHFLDNVRISTKFFTTTDPSNDALATMLHFQTVAVVKKILQFIVIYSSLTIILHVSTLEEGGSSKKERAPSVDQKITEPQQSLDDQNGQITENKPSIPPGFLNPSVQEYLELGKSVPGRPGTDYPVLSIVPYTDFYCDDQPYPGFFADMETRCQAWHYCDIDGRQASFLCPNGTQFNQAFFICDWWFNVKCELSPKLYHINSRLYQRPKLSPTRPHRVITKQLLDNIFLRKR